MGMRHNKLGLAVFFCSAGTVCAGPVMGQNAAGPNGPAAPVSPTSPVTTAAPANPAADAGTAKPAKDAGAKPQPDVTTSSANAEDQPTDLFTKGTGAGDQAGAQGQKVEIGTYGQIDLHVKGLPVTKVLQLLSIQSQRNIIASRNVSGAVSADLYGVSFRQALDAILHSNGFDYQEKGNFIYVYTADEMKQIRQQQRHTVTRVIRLNYLSAKDASALVSPMLTPGTGSISVSAEASAGFQPSVSDGGANSFAAPDTLIIRDYADNVDKVQKVIKQLDKRPRQVLIKATVLQAKLNENNAFGVDFALFSDLHVEDFSNPLSAVGDLINGSPTGSGGSGGGGGGGGTGTKFDSGQAITSSVAQDTISNSSVKVGFLGSNAAVFVRALDSVTDTTVLASPKLLVLNRQKAHIHVGGQLGYISTTQTDSSNTQTVEFLDVGTELSVRPFIGDDNFIRMELQPSVSDGSTSTVSGLVIPDKTTSEMTTNVLVRNDQTVVLGGLFKEDTTTARSQIPGLGDIPIIGNLGKAQDDNVTRNEVIFLIKPTIMKDKVLTKVGDRAIDSVQAAQIGARRGLLPWSTTKLTSAHMRDALKELRQGNRQKALWNVNLALCIDPSLPQALKLKARLTGKSLYLYDHSLFNNLVNTMIDDAGKPRPIQDTGHENLEMGRAKPGAGSHTTAGSGEATGAEGGLGADRAADAASATTDHPADGSITTTDGTANGFSSKPAAEPTLVPAASPAATEPTSAPAASSDMPTDAEATDQPGINETAGNRMIDMAVRRYADQHTPGNRASDAPRDDAGADSQAAADTDAAADTRAAGRAIAAVAHAARVRVVGFVDQMLASQPEARGPAVAGDHDRDHDSDFAPAASDQGRPDQASPSEGTFTGVYTQPGN